MYLVHDWITLLSGCMRCFVGFLLLLETTYVVKIYVKNKKRHRIFFKKEAYRNGSKRYIGIPPLVSWCPQSLFFVQCTANWRRIHGITFFIFFIQDIVFWPERGVR